MKITGSILFAACLTLLPTAASANDCPVPLTWSVGSIDRVFNLSAKEIRSAALEATELWDSETSQELFSYDSSSEFKVVLQDDGSHEELQSFLSKYKQSDAAKRKIERQKEKINRMKQSHQRNLDDYLAQAKKVNELIDRLNQAQRESSPDMQYIKKLQRKALAEKEAAEQLMKEVESNSETINNEVDKLNAMIDQFNTGISEIPALHASRAGRYIYEYRDTAIGRDREDRKIEVYRFANRNHLVWILAHEFGHALGFGHIDQSGAVMAGVNNTTDSSDSPVQLSPADKNLLASFCGE